MAKENDKEREVYEKIIELKIRKCVKKGVKMNNKSRSAIKFCIQC